ncbi:MAG: nitrile hydratase accessory protein [Alphaproteobacteria bacterium]|nr:nitrile hydratase accessory protein [Alphaproteobacteria bacterium]
MTTSNRPEADAGVFAAPWEARAFALVHDLHARGMFDWREFQEALAAEIAHGGASPEPTSGTASVYYMQWFAAALRLLEVKGIVDPAVLAERRAAIEAALRDDHDHDHHA